MLLYKHVVTPFHLLSMPIPRGKLEFARYLRFVSRMTSYYPRTDGNLLYVLSLAVLALMVRILLRCQLLDISEQYVDG